MCKREKETRVIRIFTVLLAIIILQTVIIAGLIVEVLKISNQQNEEIIDTYEPPISTEVELHSFIPDEPVKLYPTYNPAPQVVEISLNSAKLEDVYDTIFIWQRTHYVGDFKVEHLYYLNSVCERYDIPMEIMLSMICLESSFQSTTYHESTNAIGWCQMIPSTAEFIYEKYMKWGNYNVSNHVKNNKINWKLNLELGCALLKYNYEHSNYSWESAVGKYYGGTKKTQNAYINRVNTRMYDLFGTSINMY